MMPEWASVFLILALWTCGVAGGDKASRNLQLGKGLLVLGNSSQAIDALSANFYLDPSSISVAQLAQTSFLTATAFLESTKFFAIQAALFYLHRTLDLAPRSGIAHQKISELLLRTNTNLTDAMHHARAALDLAVEWAASPEGGGLVTNNRARHLAHFLTTIFLAAGEKDGLLNFVSLHPQHFSLPFPGAATTLPPPLSSIRVGSTHNFDIGSSAGSALRVHRQRTSIYTIDDFLSHEECIRLKLTAAMSSAANQHAMRRMQTGVACFTMDCAMEVSLVNRNLLNMSLRLQGGDAYVRCYRQAMHAEARGGTKIGSTAYSDGSCSNGSRGRSSGEDRGVGSGYKTACETQPSDPTHIDPFEFLESSSSSINFGPHSSPLHSIISARVKALTGLSEAFSKHTQVRQYANGQAYPLHSDCGYDWKENTRAWTLLVYLNTVPVGGATQFPHQGICYRIHSRY
jgi:hypothetical protein